MFIFIILWISVWWVILVGWVVRISFSDSDFIVFLMVSLFSSGWFFSLCRVWVIISGLLVVSFFGEMLWYCLVVLVRFRNWLNVCVMGSSLLFDKFCKVVSNSWWLVLLLVCEDFDNLWIVFMCLRMCFLNVSLMVFLSILLSILILLCNVEYCLFILF